MSAIAIPEKHFFYQVKPSLEEIFIQLKKIAVDIGSGG